MRHSTFIAIIGAALVTSTTAQVLATDEIPPVAGLTTTAAAAAATATSTSPTASVAATSTTSIATSMSTSTTSSYSYPAGSTLSNGGYVCNPAHFYGSSISCDSSGATPTLVTISISSTATAAIVTSTAAVNGSATIWMGSSGTATAMIGVWTGAAVANAVPVVGALVAGVIGLVA